MVVTLLFQNKINSKYRRTYVKHKTEPYFMSFVDCPTDKYLLVFPIHLYSFAIQTHAK